MSAVEVEAPLTAEQIEAALEQIKEDARALVPEMLHVVEFRTLLDDVATNLPTMVEHAESKAMLPDARPMFLSGREMRRRAAPPPEYIVHSLIPKEGVGALSGEPKAAKSWDATYLAVCIAAGVPVFGKFAVQKPAAVAYFYAEDTESAVNNRREAIVASLGLDPIGPWLDNWFAQPRGRHLDVMNTAQLCVLAASLKWIAAQTDRHFALLILDPLSNIHSGEEDKRDSMVKVMARLHALEAYLGLAILFVHHSGKESADNKGRKRGGQKMRGSSAIHGAVDFGLYLSNLRGNGKSEFIARVESEMKAARGAGVFDRTLTIEDNEKGNAIKATFSAAECAEGSVPKDVAQQRAFEVTKKLFDQSGPLTRDALKAKIRGGSGELTDAVAIAIEAGWIEQRFKGRHSIGYVITDAGRELIRDNGAPGATGDDS